MSEGHLTNTKTASPNLTRRSFLKWSAALGGAAVLTGGLKASLVTAGKKAMSAPLDQVFRSANNPECNHCAFQVHVRDGRIVRLAPDPDFYLRPCLRGYSRLQGLYSTARLKYPFKRVGERGEGKWERISWDEALDTVAEKLAEARDEFGAETVLFQRGAVLSQMPGAMMGRFANVFGKGVTTAGKGGLCCNAMGEASTAMIGYRVSEIENFAFSKLHISWGHNPAVSYTPHWRYMANGIEKGMRLVTIDPRFSETAAKSDVWLAPRPGTDTAIAMGMIKVIIDEKLYDETFMLNRTNMPFLVVESTGKLLRESDLVAEGDPAIFYVWDLATKTAVKHTEVASPALSGSFEVNGLAVRTVFSRLAERAARYDVATVSEISGVDGNKIVLLAREYAASKPAMINSGMSGAQRTTHGEYFVASLITLAALTGNYGMAGAGVNDTAGVSHWPSTNISSPFESDVKGSIPATKLGEYLWEQKPYPLQVVYWQGKGLGQSPNSSLVRKAMIEKIPFIVVQDNFMTDAAQIADIVLPAAHLFERYDLMAPSRNFHFQIMDKAAEPLWEARSDTWIYTELAKRLGFGDQFNKTEEEWIDEMLVKTGLTAQSLRESGPVWMWSDAKYNKFGVKWDKPPFYWFKDTPFTTPSGRIEIHSVRWEDKEEDPMVDYKAAEETAETAPELYKKYPLALVNAKINAFVHSTYQQMAWIREIFPQPWVDIHEEDATERGIEAGDMVEVLNDRGTIKLKARVHQGIRKGVVSVQNGWWLDTGGNASVLSNDSHTKISFGHTLNSTLVEVRKA
ncbi:MAG: molybdopterin-dependent oxidoreductase [Anaerolineales bacterium]